MAGGARPPTGGTSGSSGGRCIPHPPRGRRHEVGRRLAPAHIGGRHPAGRGAVRGHRRRRPPRWVRNRPPSCAGSSRADRCDKTGECCRCLRSTFPPRVWRCSATPGSDRSLAPGLRRAGGSPPRTRAELSGTHCVREARLRGHRSPYRGRGRMGARNGASSQPVAGVKDSVVTNAGTSDEPLLLRTSGSAASSTGLHHPDPLCSCAARQASGHVEVDAGWCVEDGPGVLGVDAVGAGVVDDEGESVRGEPDIASFAALA